MHSKRFLLLTILTVLVASNAVKAQNGRFFFPTYGDDPKGEYSKVEVYGIMDRKANVIADPGFYPIITGHWPCFSEGIAIVKDKEGNTTAIDTNGNMLFIIKIPDLYMVNPFHHGRAMFRVRKEETELSGYINDKGDVVIKPLFDDAHDFSEELASVQNDEGRWGFIDMEGNFVIEPQFLMADNFSEGLAEIYTLDENSMAGYVDKEGRMVIEPRFTSASEFHEGLAGAYDGETMRYGIINQSGEYLTGPKYNSVGQVSQGLIAFQMEEDSEYGFIDGKGNVVIAPAFESARAFSEGLARVRIEGLYGFIDSKGRTVIKPQFIEVSDFHDGVASFENKTHIGLIDRTGKIIYKTEK